MADIFLPTVHTFENENTFTGSCGALRFRAEPRVVKQANKEVDRENSSIFCQLWHGEKCYELSEMEKEKEFPMSEQGRAELKSWLEANV